MNLDICCISKGKITLYDFLRDGETEEELLKRAEASAKKFGAPDAYEVVTYDEYQKRKREHLVSLPVTEITKERYEYMLNVLPPVKYGWNEGILSFFMSEAYEGTWRTQVASYRGRYYEKLVDFTDKTTWLHNFV